MGMLTNLGIQVVLATLLYLIPWHEVPAQTPSWVSGSVRSADGVSIRYQTAGEGSVSLVFVHGWTCNRGYWREQLDFFAQEYRVVALDLAGHGESGLDRADWTLPAFGRDVVAVMSDVGHFLMMEAPETFNSVLASAIEEFSK